jgi:hypothetical protein
MSSAPRASTMVRARPPTHSESGSSWSNDSAASVPSKENHSRFFLPGDTWLITTDPSAA